MFCPGSTICFCHQLLGNDLTFCVCVFAAVVKIPPSNLWIMAVLTPLFLLMVVIGMVAFILCKRNRVIFKSGAFRSFKTRSKVKTLILKLPRIAKNKTRDLFY